MVVMARNVVIRYPQALHSYIVNAHGVIAMSLTLANNFYKMYKEILSQKSIR